MIENDPKHTFAVTVVERLQKAGYTALWAGGCVRDLLSGHAPADYDVATSARPDEVRELFGQRHTVAVGAAFGVILVRGPRGAGSVEVATFRSEGPYQDGRRPSSVVFSSPEEDAQRRDFTINGMFYDPLTLQLQDFVGGQDDLKNRIIRAIGIPQDRMEEDKLRLLRAVRFTARFDFELDSATAAAICERAADIRVVSAERIAQELRRMLVDPNRARAIVLAHETGLLREIFPELYLAPRRGLPGDPTEPAEPLDWHTMRTMLAALDDPTFELAAAVLFFKLHGAEVPEQDDSESKSESKHDAEKHLVRHICKRLRLSNHETDKIGWLVDHQSDLAEAPKLPLSTLKRLLAHQWIDDLLKLHRAAALATGGSMETVTFCEEYLRSTPREEINPPPLVTGIDLIQHGLKTGPRFSQLLEAVRDAQLNGEIQTKKEAMALVQRLEQSAS